MPRVILLLRSLISKILSELNAEFNIRLTMEKISGSVAVPFLCYKRYFSVIRFPERVLT